MSVRLFRNRAGADIVMLAVARRPDAGHPAFGSQRIGEGPKDEGFQVSSHAFRSEADAAGGRKGGRMFAPVDRPE